MNREPIYNDWINHDSEKCPIAYDAKVEVMLLRGEKTEGFAGYFEWGTCGNGTIIKYRTVIDTNINHVTTTNLSEELASMSINKYNKPCKGSQSTFTMF